MGRSTHCTREDFSLDPRIPGESLPSLSTPVMPALGARDQRGWLRLTGHLLSPRFSGRRRLKGIRWRVTEQEPECPSQQCEIAPPPTRTHTCSYIPSIDTPTHSQGCSLLLRLAWNSQQPSASALPHPRTTGRNQSSLWTCESSLGVDGRRRWQVIGGENT